ncbi:formate dehydrogenase subunit gamma [Rhodobacteraceae bacterium 2CG4]|uniref:Formate dehydrogenase subunit gamma n=2 Tax=Halovulum marinum TaxID=2662447 RepID=A0A6L5Z242_9RHOB|nr:formate dehydrogenase subunit gamma [Halovulum marinum]
MLAAVLVAGGPPAGAQTASDATLQETGPAQEAPAPDAPADLDPAAGQLGPDGGQPADRAATGGAQTLEDILRRQRGEKIDDSFRRQATGDPDAAMPPTDPLGTLGGASDADLYRALRYGSADVTVSSRGPGDNVLVQDSGIWWLEFRRGPLATWGGYGLLGVIGVLALFFLLRGRIRIDAGKSGITILRFTFIERFAHWLLAGSFLLLAFTGLITLFGRVGLIPLMGKEAYATLAVWSKWTHNNVSWAFMLGLLLVFLFWVLHNIPNKYDLKWMAKGGGIFNKSHPPAKKFNAGQKMIFWAVIVLGVSVSASGLSLLFPFELNLFAPTFDKLNAVGAPGWVGLQPLATDLAPHQEMQYAQLWHAVVGFAMMAVVLAHIYIGTIGMEGAFDAMGSGQVDRNWAVEHHNLWVEEVEKRQSGPDARPVPPAPAE